MLIDGIPACDWVRVNADFGLAPRESEILKGILCDRKEAAIAYDLGISQKTVHTYVERVYKKLDVHSRVQAVLQLVPYMDQSNA